MKTAVIGFPRIGRDRELKFISEKYFKGEADEGCLEEVGRKLREYGLLKQKEEGVSFISSNDFSFYDNTLDTAVLFNVIPERYKALGLSELGTYFAMARGYQGDKGNVKALAMKKWFNTNYHYLVPEISDDTLIKLSGDKPVREYKEAKALGVETKVTLVGPFTLLKLAKYTGKKKAEDFKDALTGEYIKLIGLLGAEGAEWIEFDEPYLVKDLDETDIKLFEEIYRSILSAKNNVKILLETYFGDIRDVYEKVTELGFDGVGLDFIEGVRTAGLIEEKGFPDETILFAGVVNGKNIWRNDYKKTLNILNSLEKVKNIVISTSCSL
ncbi:MAG: 5-methyltetrahydropteroyltriglutamate--homocysteine S-methyltransferase, partial [Eubacterium sp.]|nr:5-methyltetrahydropteroyltriglutamate--homocysteine S-methyltransferase [Eubacterium sp.]